MPDLSYLKSELAMYGIRLTDGGQCEVFRGQNATPTTVQDEVASITDAVKSNKQFVRELWKELGELLKSAPDSETPGNDITQRLFSSAVVWLHTMAGQFRQLVQEKTALSMALKKDVHRFSEAFMSKVVQYRVVIDWMDQIIRIDSYKLRLLKLAGSAPVTAQSGPWSGGIYLNMDERVLDATGEEDEEDKIQDGRKMMAPYDKEMMLPETYNDPNKFEAGFYYREIRNEPYAFDNEDENPYPHRNLLWQ